MINLKAIHPKNGNKFSPNLYAWLSSRKKPRRAIHSRVFHDYEGKLWIGEMIDDSLIGTSLNRVLCDGSKAQAFSFCNSHRDFSEIVNFWDEYERVGRCAIDREHKMFFINDHNRWNLVGEIQQCSWCGFIQETHD